MTRPRDPDVTPVGFGATDGPRAIVRRRRSPVWLGLCIVLGVAGLAGIGVFIAAFAIGTDVDGDAVATGRIAALDGPRTPAQRFRAPAAQDYTVWLSTSGVSNSLNEDRIVAATNCSTTFSGDRAARFRGARQGSSVVLGARSTVGTFKAPAGIVAVACHQEPWGHRRGRNVLRAERTFYVVPGKPPGRVRDWVLLFAGIAALILAPFAGSRWWQGALRHRVPG